MRTSTSASGSSRSGIEQEARKLEGTNFVVNSRFKPFAVRDGQLITGQQQ
jgi:hypothetical protein